jgi:hypothetical protein
MQEQGKAGAPTCGPRNTVSGGGEFDSNSNFKRIQIIFKFVQTLTAPKRIFSSLEICNKYGLEDIEKINNFLYRNFSRFMMENELKFQEASMS